MIDIIKIENIFESIRISRGYQKYRDDDKYDTYIKAQKAYFEEEFSDKIIAKVKEIIQGNVNYSDIEIIKVEKKYTKHDKYIKIHLKYNNDREINVVKKRILTDIKKEITMNFWQYNLFAS